MTKTFTTNINCSHCVAKVSPSLTSNDKIIDWEVDTTDERKLLYVNGELSEEEIIAAVAEAGYTATAVAV